MTRKNKNLYRTDYSSELHPNSDGTAAIYHKPRRDYWGNLYDEDTLECHENPYIDEDGANSLFDKEDDHDYYYESEGYD